MWGEGEWWRAGGPSGGNGGQGGNVWAVADESLNSLSSFRRQVPTPQTSILPAPQTAADAGVRVLWIGRLLLIL